MIQFVYVDFTYKYIQLKITFNNIYLFFLWHEMVCADFTGTTYPSVTWPTTVPTIALVSHIVGGNVFLQARKWQKQKDGGNEEREFLSIISPRQIYKWSLYIRVKKRSSSGSTSSQCINRTNITQCNNTWLLSSGLQRHSGPLAQYTTLNAIQFNLQRQTKHTLNRFSLLNVPLNMATERHKHEKML